MIYIEYLLVLIVLFGLNSTSELNYFHDCPFHSICVPHKYCLYEDFNRLKWCDEKKSFLCCPKEYYLEDAVDNLKKPLKRYDKGSESFDRKYQRVPDHRESHGYFSTRKYGTDFYDDHYNPHLSNEALRIMKIYDEKECGFGKYFRGKLSTNHEKTRGITKYGEFPWQAALLVQISEQKYEVFYKYLCSASVLNPSLLLTAAHCVKGMDARRLRIKLGDWNLKGSYGELLPTIERKIKKIIIHDYYESENLNHDIAILVLHRPVNLRKTPHISPICLPPPNFKFKEYSKCYVVGWGSDGHKVNYGANLLKVASVSLLEEKCHKELKKAIPSISNEYLEKEISCIQGYSGKEACIVDGGSGIVCPISNEDINICGDHKCHEEHYFLAGISSWGTKACHENSVTVVTRIEKYLEWIKEKAKSFGGLNYMYDQYDDKFFYDNHDDYDHHDYRYDDGTDYSGYRYRGSKLNDYSKKVY